jgi:hypothetical protein
LLSWHWRLLLDLEGFLLGILADFYSIGQLIGGMEVLWGWQLFVPKVHMTWRKNKNMKGNTRTQKPEPWWLLHHQGLWNVEGSALGQW